jgi:RNA polymerase sigma-70 factor (ECF subfamily)
MSAILTALSPVPSAVVVSPLRLDRLPDDALLAALGLGEPDAAAVFVRRFQRRVYGLAYLITRERGLAEDAAQQAFERAWRHAASFDARRGSVLTWLLSITRNVAIDLTRVRRPTALDPADLQGLLPPTAGADPEQSAIRGDLLAQLRPVLDGLPDGQRRAVLLATLAGLTTTEIARLEGVPVPTAKTRLRTGLAKLHGAMTREVAE